MKKLLLILIALPMIGFGQIFWDNNFDNPTDWTLDNNGQGAPNGWTIDTVNDGWWSAGGITSTSGGNFAELTNGDPSSSGPGTWPSNVTYTMTVASSIDVIALAGTDKVMLSFKEFGARFNDLQEVQISTDGINFTAVCDNLSYTVLSQSGGSAYPNPSVRTVNIQQYIAGNPSSVWIRFSWTTNYPTQTTNPNVWIAYGWFIDDVSLQTLAQTYVPDDNFEQALINLGYDNVLDDSVLTANINTITSLNVGSQNISDLTGIEDFTALTTLHCGLNNLTSLDVSNNTYLDTLYANDLQITTLNLSSNLALKLLNVNFNYNLTALDVSNNTALTVLRCDGFPPTGGPNTLSSLDVSNNTALTTLTCNFHNLSTLDVTQNTNLTFLACGVNQIDTLDLSQNIALNTLYCGENQLSSLDLSQNIALTVLNCSDNQLSSLDLRNGNNINFVNNSNGTGTFDVTDNPNLTCINVDNASWSTANLTSIDTQHYFSNNCNAIYGCTDTIACNYVSLATIDDSSCVYPSSNSTTMTACDTYSWNGMTYTTSGIYLDVSTNSSGCPHTETLNLTINNNTSSTDTHVACDEFMWYCDGNTYTSSNNTATYVYTNAVGCDSTVTLDLTINNSTSNSTTATSCDSYTWAVDGNIYTTSGTYTIVSTNAAGCDHTETLELTINYSPNTTNILGVTNVEFLQIETYSVGQNLNSIFSWHLNNGGIILNGINTNSVEVQWGSIGGSYDLYVIETTQDGCSDTALIVVNANCLSNASSSTTSACDTYSWDGMTYTTSGTYTNTYTNVAGCDSVHTLDLTIYSVIASISQSGDNLSAVTTPVGLDANWYNIQAERIWLMKENASSFSPTFDCSYFIVVSDNGCTDTSEIYAYGENAARIGSFTTSPNPTTGLINVKFNNSKSQFVMLELISNNGSKLDEFITIDNNLDIDLSKYPSGTYYLYFNSEDAVQGCRLEQKQKISTKIILNK